MRFPFFRTFLLCLVLLYLRAWGRILQPELWAEDAVFLSNVVEQGWNSLFLPLDGFFHFIQYFFVNSVLALFPLKLLPTIEILFYWFAAAFIFAYFARPTYRWIISKDWQRCLVCGLFCFTPGLNEMFGNLPNLNWFLYFWLLILLLKDPKVPFSFVELVFSVAITFSVGPTSALVPLAIWRLWIIHKYSYKGKFSSLFIVLLFLMAQVFLFKAKQPGKLDTFFLRNIWLSPYFKHFFLQIFIQPIWGDNIASKLWQFWPFVLLVPAVTFFAFLFFAMRKKTPLCFQSLCIAIVSTSGTLFLCWMARTERMLVAHYEKTPDLYFWQTRYAFILALCGILFWGHLSTHLKKPFVFFLFCFLTIFHSVPRFTIQKYGEERLWQMGMAKWERKEPGTMRVAIYPATWSTLLPLKQK